MDETNTKVITPDIVVAEVTKIKEEGYRLITMTAVDLDENSIELLYHFDKELAQRHLRMTVSKKDSVPSISGVYFAAFLIENEIEDQFGTKFDGLVLDFGGKLYLEDEVMRTPFCKYSVTRKGADGEAEAPEAAN